MMHFPWHIQSCMTYSQALVHMLSTCPGWHVGHVISCVHTVRCWYGKSHYYIHSYIAVMTKAIYNTSVQYIIIRLLFCSADNGVPLHCIS